MNKKTRDERNFRLKCGSSPSSFAKKDLTLALIQLQPGETKRSLCGVNET